jgi:transcription antitermination factor NusG
MTPDHKSEVSGKAGEPVEVQVASQAPSLAHWYALYTRSHCEQLVADQLAAKGFQVFLPKLETWSRRAGRQHLISLPMFPSHLFLHHAMDKTSYIEVRKARGLVRILGERWYQLGAIPEAEIEAIQKAVVACVPLSKLIRRLEQLRRRIQHVVVRRLSCWNDEEIEHLGADSLGLRQFCRVYPQAVPGGATLRRGAHLIGAEALAVLNNRLDSAFSIRVGMGWLWR